MYPKLEEKQELNAENNKKFEKGRIVEVQRNIYTVDGEHGSQKAQLGGKFYKENAGSPVVGDYVIYSYNAAGRSIIKAVTERKNILKRPDQSGHAARYVKTMKEQALAANFEYVFIVTSLNQNYSKSRIARYISVALQSDAKPVVILTKADLCDNPEKYSEEIKDISDEADVWAVSAVTGQGMDKLEQYLKRAHTIVLIGSSGVGKSTLVNFIAGKEWMKTGKVRESDDRGRHTTTHRELITLSSGVTIIDSPGIREIGMCDVNEGISQTFTDITELITQCRFSNCKHKTEPGCAITKALEEETLSKERWQLYCNLNDENSWGTEKLVKDKSKTLKARGR